MRGKLVDMVTGEPIPFAYVTTTRNGTRIGTQSDDRGLWSFEFLSGEPLTFDVLSYAKAFGVGNPDTFLISQMQPKAGDLGTVDVYPNRGTTVSWAWWLLLGVGLVVATNKKKILRR